MQVLLVLLTDMTSYADALAIVSNRMDQIPSKDSMHRFGNHKQPDDERKMRFGRPLCVWLDPRYGHLLCHGRSRWHWRGACRKTKRCAQRRLCCRSAQANFGKRRYFVRIMRLCNEINLLPEKKTPFPIKKKTPRRENPSGRNFTFR